MKRSLQEYVELVVFGLIALLVGTGLLWVVGWVLSLGGIVLKGLAGLLWMLLRFIVPVAIAGGLVYFLVKAAQGRQRSDPAPDRAPASQVPTGASYTPPSSTAGTAAGAPAAAVDVSTTGGVTNGGVAFDDAAPSNTVDAVDPVASEVVVDSGDEGSEFGDAVDSGSGTVADPSDAESDSTTYSDTDSVTGPASGRLRNELADDADDDEREGT